MDQTLDPHYSPLLDRNHINYPCCRVAATKVNTATSDLGQWIASYLFIPYARESDGLIRPVLGLGWSLQYYLLFYFLFGIGLLLSRVKGIVLASGLLVALCIAANLLLNESGISSTFIRFVSHPIILEFAAGVLIGYCYMKQLKMSETASFIAGAAGVLLLLSISNVISIMVFPRF